MGGINLYGFVGNNSVNRADLLGLCPLANPMNAEVFAPGSTGGNGKTWAPKTVGEFGKYLLVSAEIGAIAAVPVVAVEVGPVVVGAALTHPVETVAITEATIYTAANVPGPSSSPASALASEARLVTQEVKAAEQLAANTAPKLLNQFNSAESLIQNAGCLKGGLKGGVKLGTVKGDGEAIFKAISDGGQLLPSGMVKLPDGTLIGSHIGTSVKNAGNFTIDIVNQGQRYKIVVTP
jgi:hypothetical protein